MVLDLESVIENAQIRGERNLSTFVVRSLNLSTGKAKANSVPQLDNYNQEQN